MQDAMDAVRFLLADSPEQALDTFRVLDKLNQKRRKKQVAMTQQAVKLAAPQAEQHQGLVVYKEEFHEGLIGIIASRLVDQFALPTIVVTKGTSGILKSSCRSRNVNLLELLQQCAGVLEKFGGHANAAGCSFKEENLELFREKFHQACLQAAPATDGKKVQADLEVNLEMLNFELLDRLKDLEPHGQANRKPVFVVKNIPLPETIPMQGKHLKWGLGADMEMVYWNGAGRVPEGEVFDIAFTLSTNNFRGKETRQLTIQAISS
ncbi:MAG: hypothetical protein COB67_12765 [SAR324 cluster bacterium]|uniref:Single-stranded-DNA-specific exonuclease RecJ n=1 Tax=SAR324 cluster bacterium TaxID=2024889 RepID=A0A2A4SQ95_9DELT|nr:MAG: hypothetical protein COB67_12765 [SAR324 cluster bacterium]